MNSFFKTFFACLLAIVVGSIASFVLLMVILTAIISTFGSQESFSVKPKSILKIDLSVPLIDKPSSNPFNDIDFQNLKIKESLSMLDAVALIEKAANDPNISGIYLNIPMSIPTPLSSLYELRSALEKFRQSEKFIVSYADVYSQSGLYLASVSDKIFVNPQGGVEWSGLSASVMFFKGALDKLGIQPEIIRHGKFKGAVEPFMLEKMSEENRQQMTSLIDSWWGYMVSEIARSRSLDSAALQQYASALEIGSTVDAQRLGLVDSLFYTDQAEAHLARLSDSDKPQTISLGEYYRSGVSTIGNIVASDKIALLYAEGNIVDQGDASTMIVGSKLAATIAEIRKDESIKALVLRVNSPGGSALASEVIWREVALTKAVKPVVISMGEYAASGGYYISCAADKIIVSPATLTGSIGVFGMFFNVEKGAKGMLGVNVDVVSTNTSSDLGNMFRAMTPAERNFVQRGVDSVYVRFASLVAQGRKMSYADVDSIAQGRVWSGLQAVSNGLADRTGTITDAITEASKLAGIDDFRLKRYPEVDNSFASIFSSLSSATVSYLVGPSLKEPLDAVVQVQDLIENQGIKTQLPFYFMLND